MTKVKKNRIIEILTNFYKNYESLVSNIIRVINFLIFGRFDSFLKNAKGIIHIGANVGQEREHYKKLGVRRVIWIEADPEIYKLLLINIKNYKNNKAFNFLVSDKKKTKVQFNIANNNSNSSSILDLKEAKKLYPGLDYKKSIFLKSKNLKNIIYKKKLNLNNFESLILDVQGAELKVLKGCGHLISKFKYIKLEATEFEMYLHNPSYLSISKYLFLFGFKELKKVTIAINHKGEKAYDVLYYNSRLII
jgi:FkbM family methyltransferase